MGASSIQPGSSLYDRLHHDAVRVSIAEAAAVLQEVLTRRLTAYVAGVSDGKTVTRWANREVTEIRNPDTERRLRTAYEIVQLLLQFDSPATVRAWFIGLNPQLGDSAPAEAIHDGRLQEVMGAARAFVAGG